MSTSPAIGVSACLLGERVRYDGGHKLDHYVASLGRFFRLVPVCPEVECGMPIPREAMRLEVDNDVIRLVTVRTKLDKTEQMLSFCESKVRELEKEELCGFIFKKNSPSSGLFRVKIYGDGGVRKSGRGFFADAVVRRFPLLPVEEEGRLNDPLIRENFIERAFACRRWKDFTSGNPDAGKLVRFHTEHKLFMLAHSPQIYREMGKLVAQAGAFPLPELLRQYENLLMSGSALQATVKKNTNVLMHAAGYFKKRLSSDEKEELLQLISQYHDRLIPLIVPVTLLKHYIRKFEEEYLERQVYLSPAPAELMLRNHV
ncbi:DUF523 and DUF1722 domain-containing protein [Geobacter sp. DSM 9736]|uniref:YbgA family protein n=1 Tax=Geobacter sp. DSM 9736 TaxID=1277350 RepID=UPI000B501031|nr:DUF523 and DUF1722 domain-containing protein [Geobacter sp. DSM 9736]SNB45986.1 Uncharacterized conserved protein YbgA, DUF1722 family [Geobacter sp. DSM 9736]